MHFLFSKIKTMRSFLRRKRQMFLSEGERDRFEEMCWGIRERGEFLRGTKVAEHGKRSTAGDAAAIGVDQGGLHMTPSLKMSPPSSPPRPPGPPSATTMPSPIKLYRVRSTPIRPTLGVGDVELDDEVSVKVMKSCGSYVIVDVTTKKEQPEEPGGDAREEKKEEGGVTPRAHAQPPTPLQLSVLLARRKLRALCRAYGFRGLRELMTGVDFGCEVDCIMYLKEGMKGTVGGRMRRR